MSMIGSFGLLTAAEIAALLRAPDTVVELIQPEDRSIYEMGERFHCVEKYWHAIHYLLNRKAWTGEPPLDFIVAGGEEVGDVDIGYGPARVFSPSELAGIVAALRPITDDMLRANFTPEALESSDDDIYPGFAAADVDGVIESYRGLQAFLERGTTVGLGLIVWLE